MHENAAVWIDHSQAVIVFTDAGKISTETIESSLEPHTRYQDSTGYPRPDGPHAGAGEKKYERRFRQHVSRYMDDVIDHLGAFRNLLILGPGEAKLELRDRLSRKSKSLRRIVDLEPCDQLSEGKIVAMVKEHYGIDM
ncbi:MAG: hypothetical protein IPF53_12080 [Blastocatellia bacterium]|nr:hypothetical protein [Blastocatellia bacterium]MBK6426689.1 hypothetical protein [Blastocatellia bacterium]